MGLRLSRSITASWQSLTGRVYSHPSIVGRKTLQNPPNGGSFPLLKNRTRTCFPICYQYLTLYFLLNYHDGIEQRIRQMYEL